MQVKHSNTAGLAEIARWLEENLNYPIVLFEGDMGAGKTTLIKAFAKHIGVKDSVASPTYALVNEYLNQEPGKEGKAQPIYHFDFYRIEDEVEALDIGLDEYLQSGYQCWIEWPEKIRNFLPKECSRVVIRFCDQGRSYEIIQPPNE